MGLPIFNISFTTDSVQSIVLSSRGFVVLLIKDDKKAIGTYIYESLAEVREGIFNKKNFKFIQNIFMGTPSKLKVIGVDEKSNFATLKDLILEKTPSIDYLVAPDFTTDNQAIISFIDNERKKGSKLKAVLNATGSDKEYIINTNIKKASYKDNEVVGYETRIAGIVAGLDPTRSTTYFVLSDIDSVEDIKDINSAINKGQLVLINDGQKIKIARGVNSFVSLTPSKGQIFQKIKNVETVDMIAYTIRQVVSDNYVGKFTNSLSNKNLILTALNQFLKELSTLGYLNPSYDNRAFLNLQEHINYAKRNGVNTSGMKETDIKKIDTSDNLYITINAKLLDTIEDVNINIFL